MDTNLQLKLAVMNYLRKEASLDKEAFVGKGLSMLAKGAKKVGGLFKTPAASTRLSGRVFGKKPQSFMQNMLSLNPITGGLGMMGASIGASALNPGIGGPVSVAQKALI